jgi:CRP/FNR family cyclic AMP-dependent transcriptional regulator
VKPKSIDALLNEHSFFAGMDPEWLALIAGCGKNVVYPPGATIAKEGDPADTFFAVRHGLVAVEIFAPGAGSLTVQTLGDGAILGWSWILPPHRWMFDLRAVETTRAVLFDATCLRTKCDESPAMGYEFVKRFAAVLTDELNAVRLQLLDVYGESKHGGGNA